MSHKLEIVCIDDELDMLDLYHEIFLEKKIPVKTFNSSIKARSYIEKNIDQIGAIICDVKMPELDGLTLLNEVTSKYGNLPFFLVSGFVDKSTLDEIEGKISGYLAKPFDTKDLESKVLNLVNKSDANLTDKIEFGKGFAEEALPKTLELETLLFELEKNPNSKEPIQAMYRILHTLKGTAATIGLSYLAIFCHGFEARLIPIRDNLEIPNSQLITTFLAAQAKLSEFLTQLLIGNITEIPAFEEIDTSKAQSNNEATPFGNGNKLNVSLTTLNGFVEGVGELTLMRNLILQKIESINIDGFKNSEERKFLIKTLGEMQKIQSNMQIHVEELLKIPFSSINPMINRNVRDVCGKVSKKANLSVFGESILFDHRSLQAIGDSLVHLIRNSIDHGLELPADRISAGKNETGNLSISVLEEADRIVLSLQDDGRGINTEKVLSIAVQNQVISEGRAKELSPEEINYLIFMPGFSTSDQVTDISGRGVGLDSVKKSIESIGGQVDVLSKKGIGTTFTISIPKNRSASIVKVAVGSSKKLKRFAVPSSELLIVEKFEKIKKESRFLVKDGIPYVQYLNRFLPLLELTEQNDQAIVLILNRENVFAAVSVNQLEKSESVIVRDLDKVATGVGSFRKAAISGNFGVILILDASTTINLGASA